LKEEGLKLPGGKTIEWVFDMTQEELDSVHKNVMDRIIPEWVKK